MRIVIAIGGNALLHRREAPDAETQRKHLAQAAEALADLVRTHQVVLVHGNGPQVGMLALETEADRALSRPYPLGDLVAESQGLIGNWIAEELSSVGGGAVCTLVTRVVVDADDPAFGDPAKFIGEVYDAETAHRLAADRGWSIRPDGGGWRRVVASPRPLSVVELPAARALLEGGVTVVLAGGGGVPVVAADGAPVDDGRLRPVEAVVDKDRAAALVAQDLDADLLVILTDVEGVMVDFGGPTEHVVPHATPDELAVLALPAGSMGPKVESACAFVGGGPGRRAAIGALDQAQRVVRGEAGTQITPRVTGPGTNGPEAGGEGPRRGASVPARM